MKQMEDDDIDQRAGAFDNRSEKELERDRLRKRAEREEADKETTALAAAAALADKLNGPKASKRKKLVSRNYEDEEGFLVSEEVWVNASDDEEVETVGKINVAASAMFAKKEPKKKVEEEFKIERVTESPKKKKQKVDKKKKEGKPQRGMMSFFKKK